MLAIFFTATFVLGVYIGIIWTRWAYGKMIKKIFSEGVE